MYMAAINVTKQNFHDYAAEGKGLVLADFWAPWCTYCRRIAPAFEKIAEQYAGELTAVKVNVDEEPELARRFGVMNIPTVVFLKNGQEIDRKVGGMPPQVFTGVLDANL